MAFVFGEETILLLLLHVEIKNIYFLFAIFYGMDEYGHRTEYPSLGLYCSFFFNIVNQLAHLVCPHEEANMTAMRKVTAEPKKTFNIFKFLSPNFKKIRINSLH